MIFTPSAQNIMVPNKFRVEVDSLPLESMFQRVYQGVLQYLDMSHLSMWLEENTTHPLDNNKMWEFTDHEYQIDIVNSQANRLCARKCAQVGFSEISLRMSLALAGTNRNIRIIYTLPTRDFARKFATDRFDSVINASPTLSSIIDSKMNNSEVKKLGDSVIYINGTNTQKAAISVPATILVFDEVDFSHLGNLTSYESRIKHKREGEYWIRKFSTPTLPNYGVDKEYQQSSQARFAVRHSVCGKWVIPDITTDIIIPGFDKHYIELEKEDLSKPSVKIDEAYVKCPDCGKPIGWEDFLKTNEREWVHTYDREYEGYQIHPWELPSVNTIPRFTRSLGNYQRKADWVNFDLGLPHASADNTLLSAIVNTDISFMQIQLMRIL